MISGSIENQEWRDNVTDLKIFWSEFEQLWKGMKQVGLNLYALNLGSFLRRNYKFLSGEFILYSASVSPSTSMLWN